MDLSAALDDAGWWECLLWYGQPVCRSWVVRRAHRRVAVSMAHEQRSRARAVPYHELLRCSHGKLHAQFKVVVSPPSWRSSAVGSVQPLFDGGHICIADARRSAGPADL